MKKLTEEETDYRDKTSLLTGEMIPVNVEFENNKQKMDNLTRNGLDEEIQTNNP